MNFKKPEKSEFWKNKKKIAEDIIILHMCTKSHNHMKYSSWDMELEFFCCCYFGPFFALLPPPPNIPENQNFEKMEKASDVIILNLCNKKHDHMMYAYSDIECDRHNFCHFRQFSALLPHYWPWKLKFGKNVINTCRYYPFTHAYHKSRSYDVWFLIHKVQRADRSTDFPVILGHFCPLTLLTTQKIKILKKWKKAPGDIIILHKCTINDNHMIYGPWDMKCTRQNFLSFWAIFWPFTPLTAWNMKTEKKTEKKTPGDIILYKCTRNHDHRLYCSWDMACDG